MYYRATSKVYEWAKAEETFKVRNACAAEEALRTPYPVCNWSIDKQQPERSKAEQGREFNAIRHRAENQRDGNSSKG